MKQLPRRTRLSVWGGLAATALSATAFVSSPFSPFEPSDDPTASSWCYTWGVVNPLPEEADGLRLLVEGPRDVASFYEGPGNPFGPPVSHGPTPLGYEVRFVGASVAPGQEVSVGFCTRSPIGKLRGPDNGPAYEWSRGGIPLPEQGSSAAPGYAWGYTGEAEGPFQPQLTLTNPAPTSLHIKQLEWAVVDAPLPPEALEWNKVEGLVDFRPVEVEPLIPPAASPEEEGLLKAVLPLETSPDDPRYVVLRALTVSEDGVHTVRAVMQAQLAGTFVEPTRSEATTVRWDRLVFPKEKLEPGLRERLRTEGKLPLLVYLPLQADLSHAYTLTSWEERGKYVLDQLRATAESSQKELLAFVAENAKAGRVEQYESFYVINVVVVTAGEDFLDALAARPEVAYIEGFAEYEQPESSPPHEGLSTQAWNNVGHIGAPAVWNQLGLTGTGVVVANIDTGVQFNHPSLLNQYRGTATGSHDFNWFDASTYNPNSPPGSGYQAVPYDPNGHGTHTMGTIVGSGGIGVAPGARWIAARTGGSSYSAMALSLLRAGQWILAPFAPAAGLGPDSNRRPHVVNNSWGCRPYQGTCAGGGDLWYQGVISNWRAAGILPVFAAGNEGSGSQTLRSPGDYAESFTVGATNSGDNIAGFSSRGPSTLTGEMKPDISAPGVDIRSAWPSNSFHSIQGTSMAAPHVAGCAALIFQASQDYRLYLEFVENFMTGTAVDRGNAGPDKHYGHGRLNCFAAVRTAVEVAPSLQYMTPGVGWEAQGADIAMGNIDTNSRPDVVMMAYDAPPGANTFRYRIGWNLNTNGVPSSWQPGFITVSGLGWEGQGAGAALHDLDGNGRPELVLMAVDSPPGPNNFRFTIGWNLSTTGVASSWNTLSQVGAPGWEAQGGAIAITHLGGTSRPDLLVMMYDNPLGANQFRYMVGWDMSTSGVVSGWSPTQFIPGVGWEAQGAGIAVANLGRGSRPDLVLMAYDNPPGGNTFRYRIGWDVGTNGVSTDWGGWVTYMVDGVGWEAQGAGVAINDVNGNGIPEFFLMAYDNPYGPNTFRYKVIQ